MTRPQNLVHHMSPQNLQRNSTFCSSFISFWISRISRIKREVAAGKGSKGCGNNLRNDSPIFGMWKPSVIMDSVSQMFCMVESETAIFLQFILY